MTCEASVALSLLQSGYKNPAIIFFFPYAEQLLVGRFADDAKKIIFGSLVIAEDYQGLTVRELFQDPLGFQNGYRVQIIPDVNRCIRRSWPFHHSMPLF